MEEKQLSESESLQLIQQMIDRAKNSVVDKGTWPIYWGALITFCSLFTFCEITLNRWLSFDVFVITIPAILIQLIVIYSNIKKQKKQGVPVSRSNDAITYIWIAFTVAMLIVGFVPNNPFNKVTYLVLYGIPTFVTGGIIRFRAMTIGGIICWVCAIVSGYFADKYYLLLTAFCAISAWLIPGLIMRKKYLRIKTSANV